MTVDIPDRAPTSVPVEQADRESSTPASSRSGTAESSPSSQRASPARGDPPPVVSPAATSPSQGRQSLPSTEQARQPPDPEVASLRAPEGMLDPQPLPPDFGAKATAVALGMLGRPYRLGGVTPEGFDCSGLVYYSFGRLGVSVPRDTVGLRDITSAIPDKVRRVGDLVFFHIRGRQYSHVGIYVGDGRFLHAPASGAQVRIEKLSVGYWIQRYAGTRRLSFAPVNAVSW